MVTHSPCQHWDHFTQFDPRAVAPNPWGFRESMPHTSFSVPCVWNGDRISRDLSPLKQALCRDGAERGPAEGDTSASGSVWKNAVLQHGGAGKGRGSWHWSLRGTPPLLPPTLQDLLVPLLA